jgi:glycerophosphoryl diester phosphodiesterase
MSASCGPRAPVLTGPLARVHLPPRGVHIARSFGSVDGIAETSSVEAFAASYAMGFRYFSTDLAAISDGTPVCIRPGTEAWLGLSRPVYALTLTDLLISRLHQRYRPLTLPTLLELLRRRPDSYLIVTPHDVAEVVPPLARGVGLIDPTMRTRIGVLCSSGADVDATRGVEEQQGPFAFVGLDALAAGMDVNALLRRSGRWQVPVVVVPAQVFRGELATRLHRNGTLVIAGPVNDPKTAGSLEAAGADGILTDSLVR